jgi:hypothetical protein
MLAQTTEVWMVKNEQGKERQLEFADLLNRVIESL